MRRSAPVVGAVGLLLVAAACGPSDATARSDERTVTVLAASSLTDVFGALARRYERDHPGVTVRVSFGASSALAQQVVSGADADVLATADASTMRDVTREGLAAQPPRRFARNHVVLAVPAGNPAGVQGLGDLGRPDLRVALCAPEVPCGGAAREAFDAAGVHARPDTLEQDVRAVLTKLRLGEVDAGVVYVTDLAAARGEVDGVPLPPAQRAETTYHLALLDDSDGVTAADRGFAQLVTSLAGQRVLARAGFGSP